jgi:DNA repair protein RecO (recombination protein O)
MLVKTPAVVLAVIKYNDTDAVIKTYTAQTGFTSFFGKGFFKGRKARQKKALFQPNALLDLQFEYKNKGQLEYIKEASLRYHYKTISLDFDKLNISTFLREILLESLKQEQADESLFNFIEQKFIKLDQDIFNPDFHIFFLLELTRFLGFFPDFQTTGIYFDLQNACFTNQMPLAPYLKENQSLLLKHLSGMIFAINYEAKLNRRQRNDLIDILMKYYQQHLAQFHLPKSIKILNQIYE